MGILLGQLVNPQVMPDPAKLEEYLEFVPLATQFSPDISLSGKQVQNLCEKPPGKQLDRTTSGQLEPVAT